MAAGQIMKCNAKNSNTTNFMTSQMTHHFTASVALLLGALTLAHAQTTLIDLDGGTYTATTISNGAGNFTNDDFDGDSSADDSGKGRNFNGLVTGSSFDINGRGTIANLNSATQANWSLFRFLGGGGADNTVAIRPVSATDASSSMGYASWFGFESSGWDALTTGTGPSNLSLEMDVNSLVVDSTFRFYIQAEGANWVSSTSWTGDVTGASIADVSTETWIAYSNANTILNRLDTGAGTVLGSVFTNIDSIGVYSEAFGFDGATDSTSIGINVDSFTAVVVPEPQTYALLLVALVLFVAMRRRA